MADRRVGVCVLAIAVTLLSSGCTGESAVGPGPATASARTSGAGSPTPSPLAPAMTVAARSYLDHALELIHDNDYYATSVSWPDVARGASRVAVGARDPADLYPAITAVLSELQDLHGEVVAPDDQVAWTGKLHQMASAPVGHLVGDVGVLELPGLGFRPRSSTARSYVQSAWQALRSLHPSDGWIVDLRADYGGDAIPMLAAVEPLLGCSRPIGYRDAALGTTWFRIRGGTVAIEGAGSGSPTTVAAYGTPPPPIPGRTALLAGGSTASSGEAALIALRCHPGARIIGEPTAGLTGSPSQFTLSDGAWPRLTTSVAVDRSGHVYGGSVQPDVLVSSGSVGGFDPALDWAARWLAHGGDG